MPFLTVPLGSNTGQLPPRQCPLLLAKYTTTWKPWPSNVLISVFCIAGDQVHGLQKWLLALEWHCSQNGSSTSTKVITHTSTGAPSHSGASNLYAVPRLYFLSKPVRGAYLVESSGPTRHSRPHASSSTQPPSRTPPAQPPTPSFNPVS